ncbi:hypothetical protein L207DRAFT_209861 [Hyaloscypha variabilis F]|uniref:Uncharacterized protein n=1 Tax=Hyaloscypha variabilis (strain UAMH 11265 / GT02V1 / F) TaxID=1149755 RepID=A0A2J6S6B6_HYAVF|nr:hypothetical protein L207DRAFT_209861 [Hyaloscypha variabilis F]
MWAAKPRQRRNIRWPNTPSHLGKRMMLDSSTAWRGQEAGTGHQHPQSCVAIPVTDPVVVQGTSRCVIVGRGHDRGQLSFTASDLLAAAAKEQLIQPVVDAQCPLHTLLFLHRQSSIVYVGIITGGDIPTSSLVHNCLHYLLVELFRSPIHHHGTLIYPLYARLCTSLGTYCSGTHIATLLARHEILHAISSVFLVSRSSRPCIAQQLLEPAGDADLTGDATDERQPQELEASRRNEVRKHLRLRRRPPGPTRTTQTPGGRGEEVQLERALSSTHLQCHASSSNTTTTTTTTTTPCRQIDHAVLPLAPLTRRSSPSLPPLRGGLKLAPSRPSILGCFWNEGLTVSIPFQRLGGHSSTLFASHPAPSNPVEPRRSRANHPLQRLRIPYWRRKYSCGA